MAQVFSPFGVSRMPPQNIEAEISLLGSLLLDGGIIDEVADMLGPEDFYKREHQIIYEAIINLFNQSWYLFL